MLMRRAEEDRSGIIGSDTQDLAFRPRMSEKAIRQGYLSIVTRDTGMCS